MFVKSLKMTPQKLKSLKTDSNDIYAHDDSCVSLRPQLRLFVFVLMYILCFCFIFMWWKYFTREPFCISVILHSGILTSVYGTLACKVLYFSLSFLSPLYETGSSW